MGSYREILQALHAAPVEFIIGGGVACVLHGIEVDMFLKADLAYESLLPDSEWIDLDGLEVRVINRRRLLAIKLAIQPRARRTPWILSS